MGYHYSTDILANFVYKSDTDAALQKFVCSSMYFTTIQILIA